MAKKKNSTKKSTDIEEVKSEKVVKEKDKKNNSKDSKIEKDNKKELKSNKKEARNDSFNSDLQHVIIVVCSIIIIFCAFYWVTYFVVHEDKDSDDDTNVDETEVSISYDRIILGRSFSMGSGEYLVLYYDLTDDEISSTYSSLASTYRNKTDEGLIPLYVVNMGDALNKSYASDNANYEASDASELKINGPTLIKFGENRILEYIEGEEAINNYLG